MDLRHNYSVADIMDEYWTAKLDLQDEADDWVKRQTYEFGEKVNYEGDIYTMTGSENGIISVTPPDIAIGIWTPDEEIEVGLDSEDQRKLELLDKMRIMSREKLEMLSSVDLSILYDEIFS